MRINRTHGEQRWGGLYNDRHGEKTEVVPDLGFYAGTLENFVTFVKRT